MLKSKNGVVAMISVVFLLLISVTAYIYLQNWYLSKQSNLEAEIYSKDISENLEVKKIQGTLLTMKNDFRDDLEINSVMINGVECITQNYSVDEGIATIDIGSCTKGLLEVTPYSVALFTNYGLVSSFESVQDPITSDFIVLFQFGPCDFSNNYFRLYGLTDLENAHADIDGSSTYNICVKHIDYILSTSGYANNIDLFYLYSQNNSAVWTQTGSEAISPLFWYNVTLSSDKAITSVVDSSDMSSLGYTCIGKIDQDDTYGSHMGDCSSSHADTIWVKIN